MTFSDDARERWSNIICQDLARSTTFSVDQICCCLYAPRKPISLQLCSRDTHDEPPTVPTTDQRGRTRPNSLSSPLADFALSFATACTHLRRWSAATEARTPEHGRGGGGSDRPAPSWSNLTGDVSTPALRTRIHPFEQAVLTMQLFTWNVACLGSVFVAIIYWSSLVR